MKLGSLFTGFGGLDLGLERAGMRVVWQVENNAYANRVLAKQWPHVPRYADVRCVGGFTLAPVDCIAGGFPCQDLSVAGKQAGITGERSGLWAEFARIIGELRPRYAIVENVPALLSGERGAWMGRVLGDLAALGYDAEWHCLSASSVGAPHIRDRVFIVAYTNQSRLEVGQGISGYLRTQLTAIKRDCSTGAGIWATEPDVGRVANGVPDRVERLRGLGNAVVPQVAEVIGRWVMHHANEVTL